MDKQFILLLIFLLFEPNNGIPLHTDSQEVQSTPPSLLNESCILFQVRGVPVKVNVTKDQEKYLNAKVGDDLRLQLKSCKQSITCVIYKNNEPASTLATDSSDSHRVIIHTYHDSIRCIGPNRNTVVFHIFAHENGKFFKRAFMEETTHSLRLGCFGGRYTSDVKLIENEKELDIAYDPLHGFTLDKTKHPPNHYYQCQYEDERIGFNYPDMMGKNEFEMRTTKYTTSMKIQCEASQNFMKRSNITVILACPNRKHCPVPTLDRTHDLSSTNVYSAQVQMKNQTDSDLYRCVFLRNGIIEAIATDSNDQMLVTNWVRHLLLIGAIIAVIFVLIHISCHITEKKKKDNKFDKELLLPNSRNLGNGHSSEILHAKYQPNGKSVVIKCPRNPSQCQKELYFFKKARHVNIIDPLGYLCMPTTNKFFNKRIKSLVLPYYQNFCLEKYIKQFYPVKRIDNIFYGTKLDENQSKEITITLFDMVAIGWQIATALEHLKRKKITHRDVAMRNVLITDDLICKLTDFERAKKGETEKISVLKKLVYAITSKKRTVPTMYPKECAEGAYYYATEVYCFGLLLLDMFRFVKSSNPEKQDRPMHCPNNIYDLISDCLKSDRKQRIEIGKCENGLRIAARQLNEEKFLKLEARLKDGEESCLGSEDSETETADYRELDSGLFN